MAAKLLLIPSFCCIIVSFSYPQTSKKILEYESKNQFKAELLNLAEAEITNLTIQISDNLNTWYSYSRLPLKGLEASYDQPNFRIKKPIDCLPKIKNLVHVETLDISFLGLKKLPKGIRKLKNLKSLDISFNYIDLQKEIETIRKLPKLEELVIFGLLVNKEIINKLTNEGKTEVLYSQEQHFKFFERHNEK
ncbi:MAG: hypothetical protein AAGH46_08445 [Bacteroidota bacterium]